MPISVSSAMGKLAAMERTAQKAKKRAFSDQEKAAAKAEYLYNSGVRFAAAAAAGAADAVIDDTMAGMTPAEMLGLGFGVLSFTGVLGGATKTARSTAEGALCYALGSRVNAALGGNGSPAAELPPAGEGAVAGEIDASEEDALLAAMREEHDSSYQEAAELID